MFDEPRVVHAGLLVIHLERFRGRFVSLTLIVFALMEGVCFVTKLTEDFGGREKEFTKAGLNLSVKVVVKASVSKFANCKVTSRKRSFRAVTFLTQLNAMLTTSFTVLRAKASPRTIKWFVSLSSTQILPKPNSRLQHALVCTSNP